VIERFYFLCAEKAGFEWMKIALTPMHPQFADRVLDIKSREQLQQFMKQHTQNLLETHENAEPVRSGTTPLVTGHKNRSIPGLFRNPAIARL
jgi:hypothetical protein